MNNTTKNLLLILFCALVAGCENTLDVQLPYERRIVVDGFVGRESDRVVSVTRTLPPLTEGRFADAILPNAAVTLSNGDSTVTLQYTGSSARFYLPERSFFSPGKTITLTVSDSGDNASAVTRIPVAPEILSAEVRDTTDRWGQVGKALVVRCRVSEPCMLWVRPTFTFSSDVYDTPMTTYSDPLYSNATTPTEFELRTWMYDERTSDTVHVDVFTADRNFGRYLETRYGNNDDFLSSSASNPYFNVTGKGIGCFYGVSSSRKTIVY